MSNSTRQWIQNWISQRNPGEAVQIEPDTDLYGTGLLDSLGIIELIEALEDRHGIVFTEAEMQTGLTRVEDFERIISEK